MENLAADGGDIEWGCYGFQARFLAALVPQFPSDPQFRNCVIIAGAGSGKTRLFVMGAVTLAAVNPGLPGIVTEPTYPMVTGILEPAFDELFDEYKIRHRFSARNHNYYLPRFDATIMCRSGEKPRRLRGPSVGWFGMDEVGDQKKEVFTTLQGRSRNRLPGLRRAMLAGTPRGFDWVYSLFGEPDGAERIPSSTLHRAKAADNLLVVEADPGWLTSMKESYDPELYKQEVEGEFVAIGQHSTYHAFTRAENVSKIVARDPRLPVIVMTNYSRSPLAWCVGQYDPKIDRVTILAETKSEGTTTDAACDWLIANFGQPGRQTVYQAYGDATSATPTLSQNFSDMEIVRDRLLCSPHVARRRARLRDRTNSMNGLLTNAAGEHRLIVHDSCTRLVKDLEQTRNLAGSFDIDGSDETLSHYARAVSFYAVAAHPILAGRRSGARRTDEVSDGE